MTAKKSRNRRIDLRVPGVGRLRITSGTNQRREYERRLQVIKDLIQDGRLDVLRALRDGQVSMVEVLASTRGTGIRALDAIVLHRPLWSTIETVLSEMTASRETIDRYRTSLTKLQETKVLGRGARVQELEDVDWAAVRPFFKSATDWNHLRRALSAMLSRHLGDMTHPFRRRVVTQLEWEPENKVTPDVSVERFWKILDRLPEWAHDPVLAMAFTGVRPGEYIHAEAEDLNHESLEWTVWGKTRRRTGKRVVAVPRVAWAIVTAAVPARYAEAPRPEQKNSHTTRYMALEKALRKAAKAEGVRLTLHGLRHLHGQLASDEGASDGAIADVLGHTDAKTTRRYTSRTTRRDVATGVVESILRRA